MEEKRNQNVRPEQVKELYEIMNSDLVCEIEWYIEGCREDKDIKLWNDASDTYLAIKELVRPLILAEQGEASVLEDPEVLTVKAREVLRSMDPKARLAFIRDLVNVE